ncbi:hypothetical protein IQ07DRAFT_69175 [Pyrenochaeta sp. DS3sAY3a]|nr:hypothetical protein IQ07DRAFT_69175 [Pyrenochaeta sp. DS3sAY3a]
MPGGQKIENPALCRRSSGYQSQTGRLGGAAAPLRHTSRLQGAGGSCLDWRECKIDAHVINPLHSTPTCNTGSLIACLLRERKQAAPMHCTCRLAPCRKHILNVGPGLPQQRGTLFLTRCLVRMLNGEGRHLKQAPLSSMQREQSECLHDWIKRVARRW